MAKPTPADPSGLAQYQVNPLLIRRRVADSTLVCLTAPGSIARRAVVTKLDVSATVMLELLQAPHDLDTLTTELVRQYGASTETVRDDVEAALETFVRHGWVHCS